VALCHLILLLVFFIHSIGLEIIQNVQLFSLLPSETEDTTMVSLSKIELVYFETSHRYVPRDVLNLIITKVLM